MTAQKQIDLRKGTIRIAKAFGSSQKTGKIKPTAKRAAAASRIMAALGATTGGRGGRRSGAGRPSGSFKYGMPIQDWKKLQTRRMAFSKLRQEEIQNELIQRGYAPEAMQQVSSEISQMRAMPRRQMPQTQAPEQMDEVAWRDQIARSQVSPNTMAILDRIKRIQNMGKIADIEQQRRHRERNMVGRAMNLMKAHDNMNKNIRMDITGVSEDNILKAPSVFKENPQNNIMRSNRFNILQTKEAGNSLFF